MRSRLLRGVFALIVALGVLVPAGVATAKPNPKGQWPAVAQTGPYAVGRTTFEVTDPTRDNRTLPVDVWYPSDPDQVEGVPKSEFDLLVTKSEAPLAYADPAVSTHGRFPLVVFSHGSGGIRFQSWFLMEYLASRGFIVAAPDHVGNTALDGAFGTSTPFAVTAHNRPLDISLVIDRMLARDRAAGDAFQGKIDRRRIAVAGHSFGGFTALAMASGYEDIPADPRVKAIVPISPASSILTDDQLSSITVPTLLLGGTSDFTTPIDSETTRPWSLISSPSRYRVDVDRAGHASFTNICDLVDILLDAGLPPELLAALQANAATGCAPDLRPIAEVQLLTDLYVRAFLMRALDLPGNFQPYLGQGFVTKNSLPVTLFGPPPA